MEIGVTTYVIFIVSLVLSALFSGTEIAYLSADRLRLELDKKQGSLISSVIQLYLRAPNEFIATLLVGNNLVLVTYGMAFTALLHPLLRLVSTHEAVLLASETIISTMVILLLGEFLPKVLFKLKPNGFLKIFALPVFFFYILFYPLTLGIGYISRGVLKLFSRKKRIDSHDEKNTFGLSDLHALVEHAHTGDEDEKETHGELRIFQNALQFNEVKVRDCLVPRTEVQAINVNESLSRLRDMFVETSFSRLPVYEETIDNIIGYVNAKSLFRSPSCIRDILLPLTFIPETMLARVQLTQFIRSSKSMAVVVDEFGGTAGLVTIEDLIEEIFGEIDDEHDTRQVVMVEEEEGSYLLSGRAEVALVNARYGLHIPERESYDTIAGFILENQGSIPHNNEEVIIDNFQIHILQVDGRRIQLVRLQVCD